MSTPALPPWTERPTLSVAETAELLGVHSSTIRDGIVAGQIPCLRVGRRQLIPVARLAELIGPTAPTSA